MRKPLAALVASAFSTTLAIASTANAAGPSVDANDDKVTGPPVPYVRHDGGTDDSIQACNDTEDPEAFGAFTQNNEPFSVIDPANPDLVLTGWNDYCSGWQGLGFSTDGGESWTDSLVPGYPADTVDGRDAVPRVWPNERRKRSGRGLQPRRPDVLFRVPRVQ